MSRFAPDEVVSPREHHSWAARMWRRIDRDGSGTITTSELDCEEFHGVVRSILAPSTGGCMGGVAYARAKMNMDQAINLCLRKADVNNDGNLSFHEFKAFMHTLRNTKLSIHTGHLIFALFDVNTTGFVDPEEFQEMYRFFLARSPTQEEFQREWLRLDATVEGKVSRERFIEWLQTSTNPLFRRHGPPSDATARQGAPSGKLEELKRDNDDWRPWKAYRHGCWSEPTKGKPNFLCMKFRDGSLGSDTSERPRWNRSFGAGNENWATMEGVPKRRPSERVMFSKPQSLPELKQYYQTHPGFGANASRLRKPEPRKTALQDAVKLSHERRDEIELLPDRSKKVGRMPHPATGKRTSWENNFIQAPQLGALFSPPPNIIIGDPPKHLYMDLYDEPEDPAESRSSSKGFKETRRRTPAKELNQTR